MTFLPNVTYLPVLEPTLAVSDSSTNLAYHRQFFHVHGLAAWRPVLKSGIVEDISGRLELLNASTGCQGNLTFVPLPQNGRNTEPFSLLRIVESPSGSQ